MNYDLIVHVDLNKEDVFILALNNIKNYLAALPDKHFSVVMVVNGPAVQLLKKKNNKNETFVTELATAGVQFRACANALKTFDIAAENLLPECEIIPAGVIEIVELQRKGFAYIKP